MNISRHYNSTLNMILGIFIFACLIFSAVPASAQPTGGPYGPVNKTYALPKVPGTIFFVSPDGRADKSGKSLDEPTTLTSAIERAKTGDAIVMRGGTYRTGNLVFNQGITIQPYKDEKPVMKGTFVADKWDNLGNGLWTTTWKTLFPQKPADWWRRNREGKKTPLYKFNNDMVFSDGRFLQAVGWEGEVDANTYYIDYNSHKVYIGVDPSKHKIEITAFNVGLLRTIKDVNGMKSDHKGFTLKGITLTQYAYRAIEIEGHDPVGLSPESKHGKDVVGTTIENCTISNCSRVAGYFRGDHFTMKNCKISNTSTEGVYIIGSSDVLLENNIFTKNNIEHITGYYPAAVKIFNQCYRAVCKNNLIIDLPYSNGVWYDVGNVDGKFIDNWVQGVGSIKSNFSITQPWPSDNGFFFEISKGALCAGNVFVNCDHGVWALNSSNVHFYNNTFVNSTACIARNARSAKNDHFGWHPSTGPDVDQRVGHIFVNNLLTGDKNFNRPLLYVWQPDTICGQVKSMELKQLDHNMYVRASAKDEYPLIWWSPVNNETCRESFNTLDGFKKLGTGFSSHSRYFPDWSGPLFKSTNLENYETLKAFPGSGAGAVLPADVAKLLGHSGKFIGAYKPVE